MPQDMGCVKGGFKRLLQQQFFDQFDRFVNR